MALNTRIRGVQINDDFAGAGLVKDVSDNLEVNVDDSTIEINTDIVRLKDLGITNPKIAEDTIAESKLDIHNAPTIGHYLKYTANGMEWIDVDVEGVMESDVKKENLSADIDVTGYAGQHTLASTPVAVSVQVFLNGLLQEDGTGKDYTLSGSTILFATLPLSGDILIIHYIATL